MTNTSANSSGYLAPLSAPPSYDDPFDNFLHDIVVGIAGLGATLVRPRWQPVIPKMPEPSVNWCAIGVVSEEDYSSRSTVRHDPNGTIVSPGDGVDKTERSCRTTALVSMYGPSAWANAALLVDGLQIEQNRYALAAAFVALIRCGPRRMMADFANEQWVRRVDFELVMSRMILRTYPVYNLLSAHGSITSRMGGGEDNTEFDTINTVLRNGGGMDFSDAANTGLLAAVVG